MLKKLGKKIISNFGLKILAALSAVVLWIVVVNIDDPIKIITYTTSVTIENADYINSLGKYFEVLDGSNTVSFSVSAKRSIQEKMSNSDFSAVADMEKLEYDDNNDTYRVPIVISSSKYSSNQVTLPAKQMYIEIAVEDSLNIQKMIIANTKGTVADGCALGKVEIETMNLLKISGPSSVVSQIESAAAIINVDGMSTDVTDSVVPLLYDKDGNVIDTTKLKLNLNTVTIMAQILNTKDVALEFTTTGKVASGYMVTGVEYKPENVRIKGEAATLNTVNRINIPEEVLDLSGVTEGFETVVDITSYLPEGTSLVLGSDAKITVKVTVEPVITKSFEVPVANITVENLRDGYTADFGTDFISVEVAGAESAMKNFTEKDIKGTVNASGLGRGDHKLDVKILLDETLFEVTATVNAPLTISGTDTSDSSSSGNSSGVHAGNDTSAGGNTGDNTGTSGENGAAGGEETPQGDLPSGGNQEVDNSTET